MKLPDPLNELSPDEQKILQQYLEPVRFAAGTWLFEEGSPGDGCYIIDEGEVRKRTRWCWPCTGHESTMC